jgi:hypothetical protein
LDDLGVAFGTQNALLDEAAPVANRQEAKMTLALDHAQKASLFPRLLRTLRDRLAAFRHHWFVECVAPEEDPLSSLSPRDWSDLPTWHPVTRDE